SNALLGLGLNQGDRVCILSPNSHFFLESFYATAQVGLILVPLNYRLTPEDHQYIIDHAGVSAVLVDHEYTDIVDQIRDQLPTVQHWIVADDTSQPRDNWQDWEALITSAPEKAPARLRLRHLSSAWKRNWAGALFRFMA
ncbi:MAG: AMP-binding protein, partial [Gammaproteobacteria bacterium]